MTGSRTAWLNITILFIAATLLRSKFPSKYYYFMLVGLCGFFLACVLVWPLIVNSVSGEYVAELRSIADPARAYAWKMLLSASFEQPYFGFGWGPLAGANFLVIEQYSGQNGLFLQAHNLILDLILWNGYPLALITIAVILWWMWRTCTLTKTFEQLHLMAFLMVLGTHAMVEYPLHYAFFLLPFGLIIGALHVELGIKPKCVGRRWQSIALITITMAAFLVTTRDYFRVENSFYGLRFENRKIITDIPKTPPEVFALTQFRDHLILARNIPQKGVSESDLAWMLDVVNTLPSYLLMYKLAANLALNNRHEDAKRWQLIICKTTTMENCADMKEKWLVDSIVNPEMGKVLWLEGNEK